MNTLITRSVLVAQLQCKYKAYLRLIGEHGTKSDYEMMLDDRRAKVRRTALTKIQPPDEEVTIAHDALVDTALLSRGLPYLFDVTAKSDSLEFTFDGLKKVDGVSRLGAFRYVPILFHEGSTVKKEQRTLLEVACLVLDRLEGRRPNSGIVYYGRECRSTAARLDANLKKGSRLLSEAVMMASSHSPPRLLLNKHCDFPCYSNGLKDVGRVLGCTWSDRDASGIQSIVWRRNWEAQSLDANWRERLKTYNLEDCVALKKVTDFIRGVATVSPEDLPSLHPSGGIDVSTADESDESRYDWKWGNIDFFHPDFEHINKCAYFDYQRQRVYVRTNKALKRRQERRKKRLNLRIRISKHITITKSKCPACKQPAVIQVAAKERQTTCPVPRTKRAYDLTFTLGSVKRRILGFHSAVHHCTACGYEFVPEEHKRLDRHFHGLKCFVIYLHVAHRLSMQTTRRIVEDLFGIHLHRQDIHMFKGLMARYYMHAYRKIRKRLVTGSLLHADETEVHLQAEDGYVWVFTNLEEVLYTYRPTREGAFLKELLPSFSGVLVSDFYTAYDSLTCPQQKCLIHLIQDMNRAILANPFDRDLQAVTERFGKLLRSIVETVDQHGLKKRALRHHEREVSDYFTSIAGFPLESEASCALRDRLLRYRDKEVV